MLLAAYNEVREQVDQRPGLTFGDRALVGALEDAVPGIGVAEAARAVEPGAKSPEQGAEAQRHVAEMPGCRSDRGVVGCSSRVGVGGSQPAGLKPAEQVGGAARWPARCLDCQADE